MSTEPVVFVVDDDDSVRASVGWLLESVGLPVETHADAGSFLRAWDGARAGCLVLDVRMPGQSGLDLQAELNERGLSIPIIIVTGHADVPMAVRAMKEGAFDFIEKPFNDQRLLDLIHAAIAEDGRRRRAMAQRSGIAERITRLTPREHEVMNAVVAGRSNKEIAAGLALSIKTVESHRARVMAKMRAASISELVAMVLAGSADAGKP